MWSNFYDRLGGAEGRPVLKVIGIPPVLKGLDSMLRFCYNPDTFPFKVEYSELSDSGTASLDLQDLTIVSTPVIHTTPNVGLAFDYDGKRVSYSSDTLYCQQFVEIAKDSDLLIHEGFVDRSMSDLSVRTKHGTAGEAGKAAAQAGAKRLALVHLFPPYVGREQLLINEAATEFQGEVFVPEELQEIEI